MNITYINDLLSNITHVKTGVGFTVMQSILPFPHFITVSDYLRTVYSRQQWKALE